MKSFKKLYGVLVIALLLMLSSCNKWLDLKPQDGIVREDYWKTQEHIQATVNGIYASLLEDGLVSNLFGWGEIRADMLNSTSFTSIDVLNMMSGNTLPTNTVSKWGQFYVTINLCNTVIKYAPQVLESDETLTQAELDAYLAEAHAARALMYFYLYRTFGDVPLRVIPTDSDASIERTGKNSKEEIYAQIVSDLQFAEQHILTTYGSQDKDKGRITLYTVYSIMADVYLWENQYQLAVDACDKIIDSRRFGLINADLQPEWFNTLYYVGNSNEGIFELQFHQGKLNPFYSMLINTNRVFVASPAVVDELYMVNTVDITLFDRRANGGSVLASDGMIWKYAGATGGTENIEIRAQQESYAHWIVYRYADILLMKAEALAWLNRGAEALELVYEVRNRAHALEETDAKPDPNDAEGIASFILQERAREFSFEGKRWFDVLRYAKRNNYAGIETLLDVVSMNVPASNVNSVRNKFRDPNSHYLPVFAEEFERDPNMVQNPFYK